jgi:hypothetical protein
MTKNSRSSLRCPKNLFHPNLIFLGAAGRRLPLNGRFKKLRKYADKFSVSLDGSEIRRL